MESGTGRCCVPNRADACVCAAVIREVDMAAVVDRQQQQQQQ